MPDQQESARPTQDQFKFPTTEPALFTGVTEEEAEGPEVLGSHVCDTCIGDNLLKSCGIRKCARCENPFCVHYACKADPLTYCVTCMSQIELTRSICTKTYEHFDEVTDTLKRYTRRAREIHLAGEDWMFAQRRVNTLTDAELDMVIEYHRQYLQLLCGDQERRKTEKAHRNAGIKMQFPSAAVTTTTVTTTKKTSTVKLDRQKEQAAALLAQLLGSGMDLGALTAKLKK
jgi:hypothetical protein